MGEGIVFYGRNRQLTSRCSAADIALYRTMSILSPSDVVVISRESLASEEQRAVIESSVAFVNSLLKAHLRADEISLNAWRSYYVDYYLAQIENGGFSQFVYNSKWEGRVVEFVRGGLKAMGARHHLALFEEGESLVTSFGARLRAFFSEAYFGTNRNRDRLDAITKRFYKLNEAENLENLNAVWLRSLPDLEILSEGEMLQAMAVRAAGVPDRERRAADARAKEPAWLKQIRALCSVSGQELIRLNAGAGYSYEGKNVFAHHFSTDKGHHFMIEVDGRALLFNGTTNEKLAEVPPLH